ncbi:MAG: hypothetical protein KY437_11065, partial [Actinobacteria bacterium]|nr:hypothetical protein [Actinomycetota bacterium]
MTDQIREGLHMRARFVFILSALALLLAACGGGTDTGQTGDDGTGATDTATETEAESSPTEAMTSETEMGSGEAAVAVAETCDAGVDVLVPALAKSLAGKGARTTATHAQQVLAGIGFTTEHPFHRWLKRSLVVDTLFGSSSSLPTEIGAELLRRGGAPRLVEL